MKKVLVSILLIVISLYSGWSNDPTVNTQVSLGSSDKAIPKVRFGSDNFYYITWFQSNTSGYALYAQKYDENGNEQWTVGGVVVSDEPQETWLTDYDMEIHPEGGFVVVFPDIRDGGFNVQAARMDGNGVALWGEDGTSMTTAADGYNVTPKVEVMPNGTSVVTWIDANNDAVVLQAISSDGNKLWEDGVTLYNSAYTSTNPDLIVCDEESFYIEWSKQTGPFYSPVRNIWLQRMDLEGNFLWAEDLALTTQAGIKGWTTIHTDKDKEQGAIISWHDDRDYDDIDRAYVQCVNKDGVTRFEEGGFLLDATSAYHSWDPICDTDDENNLFIAWKRSDAAYQSYNSVHAQKFIYADFVWEPNGNAITEESNLLASHNSCGVVDGKFFVGLERYSFGNFMYTDITGVLLDDNCDNVWGDEVYINNTASSVVHLDNTCWNNNKMVLAWEDDRNDEKQIFMQNINLDGTIGGGVGVDENTPESISLTAYPNPFNPVCSINFNLPSSESLNIRVFNTNGEIVNSLNNVNYKSGINSVKLDMKEFNSGTYFVSVDGSVNQMIKIVLLK
ncbi:MAG: T9SS type A sorting domain-containing protein [Candidatus Delongbacteria bacterium]|nr:T9SS type A sorting domain-containing protein [Candidatus Delongbacteria bacterium]MBN2836492.1 T9SS type A sorting domain-containing protein [Candidatus Delongbacteria bacterium]